MKNNKMMIYYGLFFIVLIAFLYVILSPYIFDKKPNVMYFENKDVSIHLDDTLKLNVFVEPLDDYDLVYESDNPGTLKVDDNGVVTGLRMGTATVSVKVKRHDDINDSCRVVVMDARVPVTKIKLNKIDNFMFVGTNTKLKATIEPASATNKKIIWESSNPEVASVDTSGKVKALKNGKVTITATTLNGHKDKVTLDVVTEKNLNVRFVIQDKKMTNSNDITKNCKITKNNRKCNVTVPSINTNSGYEFIGWNSNKTATTKELGNTVTVSGDKTYYSISKNHNPITVNYIIQNDTATITSNSSGCYQYNGNSSCTIKLADAVGKNGNTFIGWSTDKNSKSVNYKDKTISINKNTTLYSITKKTITITFDPNTNNASNIKADRISFTSNEHTKCDSYNGNGCTISWIPTIYSKGHVVHGFSRTPDGNCLSIYKNTFKEDTTLYARVYDALGKKATSPYKVSYEETLGNIVIEIEYGISSTVAQQFINFLKDLYKNEPELFYFNGKMVLLTDSTYVRNNGNDSAGVTWTDDYGYFSTIYIRYNSVETNGNRYFGTTVHEMGHGYNNLYYLIEEKRVSDHSDIQNLFNKYKNMSKSSRPLSEYAYAKNRSEFFSEALLEVYRSVHKNNGKEYYRSEKPSVPVTSDIKNTISKYLTNGKDYFKKVGRLS
ncbi:MAG: Ig-like domain-containing protein [Bacilli bacterium]|nr:Ig-like domain-containing protein [Bacilli bacterium]